MRTIRVEKLTRDYGHGKGVFDLSFDVQKGESFGFLGPNGAGKTTTIRHLMGFLKAKSGRCSIDGLDCWRESLSNFSSIGVGVYKIGNKVYATQEFYR